MRFTEKLIAFFQDYRPLIMFFGSSMLFGAIFFLPYENGAARVLVGWLGVTIASLDFSKVPKQAENRNKGIAKTVLRAVLVASGLFAVFWALPNILWRMFCSA